MFYHVKRLQYHAKPERPDPVYAKKLQEVLGGAFGEITVMMQYLFQGWNCRGPAKYRDLLLDVGTEEMAHVEMLATMIARLLEGSPIDQDAAASENPVVGAVLGGMSPQHAIVWGLGASPNDSQDFPWTARYMVASGNLLADFRSNLAAESQGRLQVARLYEMTHGSRVSGTCFRSFWHGTPTTSANGWPPSKSWRPKGWRQPQCPAASPRNLSGAKTTTSSGISRQATRAPRANG